MKAKATFLFNKTQKKNFASNEKLVIWLAGIGMFLSTLDSGIMNVVLPFLMQYFHTNSTTIAWTISAYLLTISTTIIFFGQLSDRLGRVKIFSFGLITFGVSSLFCGLAFNVDSLIFFRTLQGLGAAMLQATAAALITTLVAVENRKKALSIMGAILGLGPILGPTITGVFISFLNWRFIFWINIPLCFFTLLKIKKITDLSHHNDIYIDYLGLFLIGVSMFCFTWAIVVMPHFNFKNPTTIKFLAIATVALCLFLTQEYKTKNPILPPKLFLIPSFSIYLFSTLAFGCMTAIILIVPPFYLAYALNLVPWKIGLIAFSAPLGLTVAARLSGFVMKFFSIENLMIFGLFIMLIALLGLFLMMTSNIIWLILLLIFYGLGGGIFQPANIAAVMHSVKNSQQGTIGSINRMVHNFGNAIGVCIAISILREPPSSNYANIWLYPSGFVLSAFISLLFLKFMNRETNAI